TLTVLALPSQSYPVTIMSDHPVAYWRLDEAEIGGGDNGVLANDYAGGFDGSYSNAVLSIPGYNPTVDPDTAASFQGSPDSYMGQVPFLDFAAPASKKVGLSVECWVKNTSTISLTGDDGIVTKGFGGAEQFNLDAGGNDPAHQLRFYVRDASGATHGAVATNSYLGANNQPVWHHVV